MNSSLFERLRRWWAHEIAGLREGYEAQLLSDAEAERHPHNRVVPHAEREQRWRIPRELRPKAVPFGRVLRPEVLQFTLPCLAVTLFAELVRGGLGHWGAGVLIGLVLLGLWLGFKVWFLTAI